MLRRCVIERQFFTWRDVAPREEEHVTVHHAAEAVRLARVVYVGGRVAAAARIDAPSIVELADADLAALRDTTSRFTIADSLAEQLADFSPRRQSLDGETSSAVDLRFSGNDARRAIGFHFAAG